MEANTLTAKLHKAADEKLRAHLNSIFQPITAEIAQLWNQQPLNLFRKTKDGPDSSFEMVGNSYAIDRIHEQMFLSMRDRWRDNEVSGFMSKVENLQQQVDEISAQLPT